MQRKGAVSASEYSQNYVIFRDRMPTAKLTRDTILLLSVHSIFSERNTFDQGAQIVAHWPWSIGARSGAFGPLSCLWPTEITAHHYSLFIANPETV